MSRISPARALIIPAAGTGSRLGGDVPKFLAELSGRSFLEWLLALYAPHVCEIVLIVAPGWQEVAATFPARYGLPMSVRVQERATGMLDAVMLAQEAISCSIAERIWITWCDQIAVHPDTVRALTTPEFEQAALAFPTVVGPHPYIHFDRNEKREIIAVRQRREGDVMPAEGEGDAGLFSLSRRAFLADLRLFAAQAPPGRMTGERNFLPFIPWLARRAQVVTVPCVDAFEAIGVNTPADRERVEAYLRTRK